METSNGKMQGNIFSIQRYSLHDGPGIRTIVFLKGCPLHCQWCSNPESQRTQAELAFSINKCIGLHECMNCLTSCPGQAIRANGQGKIAIDRKSCRHCFRCVKACPAKALHIFGRRVSIEEVIKIVEADSIFYSRSGGGLTLSGGEPLMQADFALELIKAARRRRINTSIETCGCGTWADLEAICHHVDSVLFDIKCLDEERHKKFTRVSNRVILENFRKMCAAFPCLPVLVRTPIIPGFNDFADEIEAILDFIREIPNVRYELLPFHRLGQPKYESLGREYPLAGAKLDEATMARLNGIVRSRSRQRGTAPAHPIEREIRV